MKFEGMIEYIGLECEADSEEEAQIIFKAMLIKELEGSEKPFLIWRTDE